jgi:hypothetical protein
LQAAKLQDLAIRFRDSAQPHQPPVRVDSLAQQHKLPNDRAVQQRDLIQLQHHAIDKVLLEHRPHALGKTWGVIKSVARVYPHKDPIRSAIHV